MSEMQVSERLMDLIFEAIDEGVLPLKVGQGLMPFLMLLTKGGYVLQRFREDSVSACLEKAQAALQSQDEDTLAYALVYDAVVTIDEKDYDALMVEAGERGHANSVRFVQRYQPKDEKQPFKAIGAVALLGEADQYL